MKCSICGYEFPIFDWEGTLTFKEKIRRTEKKVTDHYIRDHRDLMIILSLFKENGESQGMEEKANV